MKRGPEINPHNLLNCYKGPIYASGENIVFSINNVGKSVEYILRQN
jgi:hypothetical protein